LNENGYETNRNFNELLYEAKLNKNLRNPKLTIEMEKEKMEITKYPENVEKKFSPHLLISSLYKVCKNNNEWHNNDNKSFHVNDLFSSTEISSEKLIEGLKDLMKFNFKKLIPSSDNLKEDKKIQVSSNEKSSENNSNFNKILYSNIDEINENEKTNIKEIDNPKDKNLKLNLSILPINSSILKYNILLDSGQNKSNQNINVFKNNNLNVGILNDDNKKKDQNYSNQIITPRNYLNNILNSNNDKINEQSSKNQKIESIINNSKIFEIDSISNNNSLNKSEKFFSFTETNYSKKDNKIQEESKLNNSKSFQRRSSDRILNNGLNHLTHNFSYRNEKKNSKTQKYSFKKNNIFNNNYYNKEINNNNNKKLKSNYFKRNIENCSLEDQNNNLKESSDLTLDINCSINSNRKYNNEKNSFKEGKRN